MHQKQPPANVATAWPAFGRRGGACAKREGREHGERSGEERTGRLHRGSGAGRVIGYGRTERGSLTASHGARAWPRHVELRCADRMTALTFRIALALLAAAAVVAAPAAAADPPRALRTLLTIAETSFDPAFASDAASDTVIAEVFEAMLDYDYLARPVKLVPRTLEAMPTSTDGGRTWTCRSSKGIRFTPDPAFGGKPRELTAADYAYTYKRILDPAVKSPWLWLFEGKIEGGDAARAARRRPASSTTTRRSPASRSSTATRCASGSSRPTCAFPYVLAVPYLGAVAREVVERYGLDLGAHPVGTGAFRLGEYKRSARMVLERNPDYRVETYTPAGPVPASSQRDRRRR